MTLDLAAVMGLPFSGCEVCDEVVVMGETCAEDISWAWETHRAGEVHKNGGKPIGPHYVADFFSDYDLERLRELDEEDIPQLYPISPYGPWGYNALVAGI